MNTRGFAGLPAVGSRVAQIIGALMFVAALLIPAGGVLADHETRDGLYTDNHYVGVQFMFELEWASPWEVNPDAAESVDGQYDRIVVVGPEGAVQCLMMFGRDLEGTLNASIDVRDDSYENVEVLDWSEGNNSIGLPFLGVTLTYGVADSEGNSVQLLEYLEVSPGYTVDLDEAISINSIAAPAESFDATFDDAQETFVYNQGIFGPLSQANRQSGHPVDATSPDPMEDLPEDQYLLILENEIGALNASVEGFYELLNDPNFGDDQSLNELSAILNSWIEAYEYAQTVEPPRDYDEVHDAYLQFSGALAQAANDLFNGDLDSAIESLEVAEEVASYLAGSFEQPSILDLLDQKSG